jgi:hypothetical protein
MHPPPLYSHSFHLTLHTSNPTPPSTQDAFDLITAHRIAGRTPDQITHAQTLGGTLRALSVHASEGQAKRSERKGTNDARPSRKQYKAIIRNLLRVMQCENGLDLYEFTAALEQAKNILEK